MNWEDADCNNDNGRAWAIIDGGTEPYSYYWEET